MIGRPDSTIILTVPSYRIGQDPTLIAAESTGRVCCGIELDPLYVDVIIRRYEAETGAAVVLADSGETFEKVTAGHAITVQAAPPVVLLEGAGSPESSNADLGMVLCGFFLQLWGFSERPQNA